MHQMLAVATLVVIAGPAAAQDHPHVYLKNDKLKVKVYLPDEQKGFYRGTRFDWAGVCGEIEFAGHKIFGPWKDKHDPTNHDDIIGPAEEFGMDSPLGYADAKVGGTFLKIGVGELEKPKEEKYQFHGKYKIAKPAAWERLYPDEKEPKTIVWQLKAAHPSGYGYEYGKSVGLHPEGNEILVGHKLVNTGTKPIVTDVYNHNFFNADGDPVGPNYSFAFPFDVKAQDLRGKFGELVELKGGEFRFKDKLADGFVMAGLTGFHPKDEKHRRFEMRHAPSGVRIDVSQNQPYSKFNVWGIKTTICPEPYTAIDLKPGGLAEWVVSYKFTQDPPKK